jgi:hypothetical protein
LGRACASKNSCGKGNVRRVGKANAVFFARNPRNSPKNGKEDKALYHAKQQISTVENRSYWFLL